MLGKPTDNDARLIGKKVDKKYNHFFFYLQQDADNLFSRKNMDVDLPRPTSRATAVPESHKRKRASAASSVYHRIICDVQPMPGPEPARKKHKQRAQKFSITASRAPSSVFPVDGVNGSFCLADLEHYGPDLTVLNTCYRYAYGLMGVPSLQYFAASASVRLFAFACGENLVYMKNLPQPLWTWMCWALPFGIIFKLPDRNVSLQLIFDGGREGKRFFRWKVLFPHFDAEWLIPVSSQGLHAPTLGIKIYSKGELPVHPCLDRTSETWQQRTAPLVPLPTYPSITAITANKPYTVTPRAKMLPAPRVRRLIDYHNQASTIPVLAQELLCVLFLYRFVEPSQCRLERLLHLCVSEPGFARLLNRPDLKINWSSAPYGYDPNSFDPRHIRTKVWMNAAIWLYMHGHARLTSNTGGWALQYNTNFGPTQVKLSSSSSRSSLWIWGPFGQGPMEEMRRVALLAFGSVCGQIYELVWNTAVATPQGHDRDSDDSEDDDACMYAPQTALEQSLPEYDPEVLRFILEALERDGQVVERDSLNGQVWWGVIE